MKYHVTLCFAFFALVFVVLAGLPNNAYAGSIINKDSKEYTFKVFWDDLSPPEEHQIHYNQETFFDDKPCTIELVGRKDSIYVKPHETIIITNGIMHNSQKKP